MNPNAITIKNFSIRWYSIFILIAFALGMLIIEKQAIKKGIKKIVISNLCFYLIIVSIIGARIYYCIFNLDYYLYHLLDIFKIWEGGLAIHGGIIASIIFITIYTKKHHINLLQLLDIFVPALILGQAIGRWGNFFNQEAYGPMTTYSHLSSLNIPKFIIKGMYINGHYFEPTFYYESIGCLIGLVFILIYKYTLQKKDGELTSLYLIIYGIIRIFIESLRTDSLMFYSIKVAQLVSLLMIIIGIILFIVLKIRSKHDQQKMGSNSRK